LPKWVAWIEAIALKFKTLHDYVSKIFECKVQIYSTNFKAIRTIGRWYCPWSKQRPS